MQKSKYNNIVCFGEVLWDMLPSGAKPGGAPLNVAIHLKNHKIQPILISKTGNGREGIELKNFLLQSGLSTDFIQTDASLPTSKVLVKLDENKNATYEIVQPVAWDNIKFSPDIRKLAKTADLIIFGSLASRSSKTRNTLFKFFENSAATRLLDVNLRPPHYNQEFIEKLLHKSDFVKLNDDELRTIGGWNNKTGTEKELILWLAKNFHCSTVCVTRGANGAALWIENNLYQHPGFTVKAEDTVGAGDSFLAALVAELSRNSKPQDALKTASATGAFVASQPGAVPQYSEMEINRLISTAEKT